jgi:KDO2-lipid IV(A) lauroyltransferase
MPATSRTSVSRDSGAAPLPHADGPGARALAAVFRAAGRLPLSVLRSLGAVLGVLVMLVSAGYRRKLVSNLSIAGYPGARWALRAAAGAGRMALELPWIWSRPPSALAARLICDDLAVLETAEAKGAGILFLTPHLGSFEVTARWYALRAPITVMFREPRKPLLRPLVREARNVETIRAVPAALSGVRAMLRALRAGEAVGLLPDQVPGEGDGRWAQFFGHPAWTMTLPERLARNTGAEVVIAVGERVRGGWRLHLSRLPETPSPQALNTRMETLVRRWPDQYLWGYNRYKRPAGAARVAPAATEQ